MYHTCNTHVAHMLLYGIMTTLLHTQTPGKGRFVREGGLLSGRLFL